MLGESRLCDGHCLQDGPVMTVCHDPLLTVCRDPLLTVCHDPLLIVGHDLDAPRYRPHGEGGECALHSRLPMYGYACHERNATEPMQSLD